MEKKKKPFFSGKKGVVERLCDTGFAAQIGLLLPRNPFIVRISGRLAGGDGKLNFRDDIYGHDKKMAAQLFAAVNK